MIYWIESLFSILNPPSKFCFCIWGRGYQSVIVTPMFSEGYVLSSYIFSFLKWSFQNYTSGKLETGVAINWASLLMVFSCLCCIVLQRAFALAFLSSMRVIVIDRKSRTKPTNVVFRCEGIKDDFSTLITNPNLANKVLRWNTLASTA